MEGNMNSGYEGSLPEALGKKPSGSKARRGVGLVDAVVGWRDLASSLLGDHPKAVKTSIGLLVAGLYHAYFFICLGRHISQDLPLFWCNPPNAAMPNATHQCPPAEPGKDAPPIWCDSMAFLIILTTIVWASLLYGYVLKPLLGPFMARTVMPPINAALDKLMDFWFFNLSLYVLVVAAFATYLIIDTKGDRQRLVGAGGFLVLQFIGWIFSVHPGKVRWRHVFWGHSLQIGFAFIVLKWPFGKSVIQCLSAKVTRFLSYTYAGSYFVFGFAADGKIFQNAKAFKHNETGNGIAEADIIQILNEINSEGRDLGEAGVVGAPFFFNALTIIYFVSFCVSMLYYWGALQFLVQKMGWLLYVTVGTTAAESMNAAANIFLGQTEAPLLIQPYLPKMTKSEINAVMTGGFATVAGTVLGAYIGFGIDANHLITCSFMAAPCTLAVAKLFYPETEQTQTAIEDIKIEKGEEANVLDAAAKGASTAIMLVLNIAASLLAFTAFICMLDNLTMWFAGHAGNPELTLTEIMGYIFWPLAFCMGIPAKDCLTVGKFIATKVVLNEFNAFADLAQHNPALDDHLGKLEPRSYVITMYALCGFANFSSIGIQLGAFGAMAEERKSDFAQIVLRAMIGGCWVSFLNACIASTLITDYT